MSRRIIRLEIKHDLWMLFGLLLVLLLSLYVSPMNALRLTLGLFYLLFVPGYTLFAALYPGRDDLRAFTRAALSFALSIPIVSLLGLLLNYTPWGIRLESTLVVVGLFALVCSGVALYRRSKLPPENRFAIRFQFDVSRWQAMEPLDKVLSVTLVLSIVAVIGALVYGVSKPQTGERFTEFYILGPGGVAEGYAEEAAVGEMVALVLGVINREHSDVQYRIERSGIAGKEEITTLQLRQGESWEQPYTLTLTEPGEDQEVEFLLYKGDEVEPYRTLHLWITVIEE